MDGLPTWKGRTFPTIEALADYVWKQGGDERAAEVVKCFDDRERIRIARERALLHEARSRTTAWHAALCAISNATMGAMDPMQFASALINIACRALAAHPDVGGG